MSPLKARLVDLIGALGPIPVAEFMAMCLYDPKHGYYTTRDPFGREGDFTTAPEVSQMFGELIGVWVAGVWAAMGRPKRVVIAEIGPGRGTLMKDMARTLAKIAPELRENARFCLVEVSPKLASTQATTLQGTSGRFDWHETVDTLPEYPMIIIGNELFDAVPMRQYVKASGGWRERMVGLDSKDELTFLAGAGGIDPAFLPPGADSAPDGSIVEISPARTATMGAIAGRIAAKGGAGLFLDYGYAKPAVGDTLQALLKHAYDDVLAHPGEADLTSHVDFAALASEAAGRGLDTSLMTQGDFLLRMGLLERAGRLGRDADDATRNRLRSEVERLAGPQQMGTLFKALCVARPGRMPEPFKAAD